MAVQSRSIPCRAPASASSARMPVCQSSTVPPVSKASALIPGTVISPSLSVRADMVGQLRGGEHLAETARNLRQHRGIPGGPLRYQAIEHVLVPLLQVGSFARVCRDIEQKRVAADFEILEIAVTRGLLRVGLVAPEQLARLRGTLSGQYRKQAEPVRRIIGVRRGARGVQ